MFAVTADGFRIEGGFIGGGAASSTVLQPYTDLSDEAVFTKVTP